MKNYIPDFSKYQYENISVIQREKQEGKRTKKYKQVIIRLFNPENKESFFRDVTDYSIPNLFISDNPEKSPYKSYLDENVLLSKKTFDNEDEFNKFVRKIKIKTGEIKTIEYDGEEIEIEETIFEDDAFGYLDLSHTFLRRAFKNTSDSFHTHRIWFLDIETRANHAVDHFPHSEMAPEEITMIQIYDNFTDQYIILGRKDFTGTFEKSNVKYIKIEKEYDLLEFFLRLLEKHNPSIISGFNSMTFDMPYITNRIARVLDGFNGDYKEELNKKNSYKDFKNVNRLSPLGVVNGRTTHTLDGMDGVEVFWRGRLLIDYRELTLKYGFLGLPSYSLKNVAKKFNLSQKIDNSAYRNFDGFYTGEGYIFPEKDPLPGEDPIFDAQKKYRDNPTPENKKELQQIVYNRFVEYSLRDVEILVELNEKAKYLDSHMQISYFCGVTGDDCWGTQKHWVSLMYTEAEKKNMILPLKQQYAEEDVQFFAGWVRTVPGKYDFISSFDFTSLYPSLIRAFNIGGDSYLKPHEMHPELKELKEKYFNYFIKEKLNRDEERGELGDIIKKYNGEVNDLTDEREYYTRLMENAEEISTILKKHNVCVAANGYFYKKDKQSIFASQMERFFKERVQEKRKAQEIEGQIEELKKSETSEEELRKLKEKHEYHDNRSTVLKVLLNSSYGVSALESNPFANGKLTAASITTSGRMSNQIVMMAINNYLAEICGLKVKNEELDFIMQSDTDSVVGDTILDINKKSIKIEDLFDNTSGFIEHRDRENLIKHVQEDLLTPSLNKKTGDVEYKRVKYIMKHKVKKRLFKIKYKNKEVIVTEDHSCIIQRDGKFIDVKPKDIIRGDKIIVL